MTPDRRAILDAVPEPLKPLLPELFADLDALAGEALRLTASGGVDEAASTAHALKGACMRFSLDALAGLASNAEKAARSGHGEEAGRHLERFSSELAAFGVAPG